MFVSFYRDVEAADGSPKSKLVKHFLGNVRDMSERSARREMASIMDEVNRLRGSAAAVIRGQLLADAVKMWRSAIAPNLSPATVRQRESYLRVHILPRFGQTALHEMGVQQIQQFATDLRSSVSAKTVVNILSTIFTVVQYAGRCGLKVQKVGFADLELGSSGTRQMPVAFFTRDQAIAIIDAASDPFKMIFAVAWYTGCRAGEILALTLADLDFNQATVRINKACDDATRDVRQPKTKCFVAVLPMPSALAAMLRSYLQRWTPNPAGILFPAPRNNQRSRSRDNVSSSWAEACFETPSYSR